MIKQLRRWLFLGLIVISCWLVNGGTAQAAQTPCEGGPSDCIGFTLIVSCVSGESTPPRYSRLEVTLFDTNDVTFIDYPMLLQNIGPEDLLYQGEARNLETSHEYQARLKASDVYLFDWTPRVRPPNQLSWVFGVDCQQNVVFLPSVYSHLVQGE